MLCPVPHQTTLFSAVFSPYNIAVEPNKSIPERRKRRQKRPPLAQGLPRLETCGKQGLVFGSVRPRRDGLADLADADRGQRHGVFGLLPPEVKGKISSSDHSGHGRMRARHHSDDRHAEDMPETGGNNFRVSSVNLDFDLEGGVFSFSKEETLVKTPPLPTIYFHRHNSSD